MNLSKDPHNPESQALLHTLIDSIPDLIFYKDLQSVYLGCNTAFEKFAGCSKKMIIGKSDLDLFKPEVAEFFRDKDRKVLAAKQPIRNEEWVNFPNGSRVLLDTLKTPYYSEGGKLIGLIGVSRDITALHENREKLRQSLSLQQATLESTADGILVVDLNGRWASYNQKFVEMWQLPSNICESGDDEAAINHVLSQLQSPENFVQKIKILYEHPNKTSFDEVFFKDGRVIERYSVPQILDDKVIGRAWNFRDVTERKQSELQIENRQAALHAILNNMPFLAWLKDEKSRFITVNDKFAKACGAPNADWLIGKTDLDIWPQELAESYRKDDAEVMQRRVSKSVEEPVAEVDGTKWFETFKTPVYDAEGVIIGTTGLARDITEKKTAEEKLRKLSQAVEQAGESILIVDKHGSIEYVNPSFTKMTGYKKDNVLGKKHKLLKNGKQTPAFYENMQATIESGEVWSGTITDIRKDGREFSAMLTVSPILNEDSQITHYVAIQQDMTNYQQLEEKFYQAQKMEALGTLVGGIAHDFNNMLGGITGNLYLAKRLVQQTSEVKKRFDTIETLSFMAADLIKQLLTFARKDIVSIKPMSLMPFIKELIKFSRSSIPENILIKDEVCDEELFINGDHTQLHQVLLNLVNNAHDALADKENPTITIKLEALEIDESFITSHPYFKVGSYAHLSVSDNGIGITNDNIEHLFEPFFTTKEPGKGTGLGLAMVFGAVKNHNGFIEVESAENKGTTFHIYLPLLNNDTTVDTESIKEASSEGKGELILIVDDDTALLEMGQEVLHELGYQTLKASNGQEAIEVFAANKERISLVMMDLVMPQLGGVKAAERIRTIRPGINIIFVTGYDKNAEVSNNGVDNKVILSKPFDIETLSKTIRDLLDT